MRPTTAELTERNETTFEKKSKINVSDGDTLLSLSLLTDWRFTRGVEEQTKAFLDGFNEVVPLEWLRYFDEKELEVRRSGRAEGRASKVL